MSATNDQVIAITTRRRPMFRPAIVKPIPPDTALVLRWLEYSLNDPYELIAVLRASQPGTFGTAALNAATVAALTGQVPPCRR